jgi:hypothetical protein
VICSLYHGIRFFFHPYKRVGLPGSCRARSSAAGSVCWCCWSLNAAKTSEAWEGEVRERGVERSESLMERKGESKECDRRSTAQVEAESQNVGSDRWRYR